MLLCIAAVSSAQTYDVIERRNSWNAGTNVTGIMMDSVTVSYAELYGKNNHGDFRNYYEAGKLWSAGAVAKSITHLKKYSSDRLVLIRPHFRQGYERLHVHPSRILSGRPTGVYPPAERIYKLMRSWEV